ncbi:MAG: aminoacetone oxidase family FAD-binding enzyme, partial [Bacilli bacterium]
LKKLLITGNGKCNYFNEEFVFSKYHSFNEELLKNIISLENKNKILTFFKSIGIIPRVKENYYYPYSNQAISVKISFLKEIENKNIKLKLNSYVKDIKIENNKFLVYYNDDVLACDKLIISTGGRSYPKTGSDGSGYNLCKKLGHTINKILPALVGLKCKETFLKKLNGVRSNATVSLFINDKLIKSEIGEVQFTNYGLSGICIFNLSSMASRSISENKKVKISINFLDKLKIKNKNDFKEFIFSNEYNFKKEKVSYLLDSLLNYKLTNVILEKTKIESNKLVSKLSDNEINILFENLSSFTMNIIDTNSFEFAQITTGGVPLSEINPLTFESKIVSNLYLTGEVLDIDGDCGGYNIAFAVLSGILAGESVKKND